MSSNLDSDLKECEEILQEGLELSEIENPTNEELNDTAQAFFEAAQCFDKNTLRKKSAKYFTLAGEFFMSIEEEEMAAECYGKAILRNLMANDIESAQVIVAKGDELSEKYGQIFDTFHFRMAKDSFTRRIDDEIDQLEKDSSELFDTDKGDHPEDISLIDEPFDEAFGLELEEIDVKDINLTSHIIQFPEEDEDISQLNSIVSSVKAFSLIEQESTKIDAKFSERIAQSLLRKKRPKIQDSVESISSAKFKGNILSDLGFKSTILRRDNLPSSIDGLSILELDKISKDLEEGKLEDINYIAPVQKPKIITRDQQSINSGIIPSVKSSTMKSQSEKISSKIDFTISDLDIVQGDSLDQQIEDIDISSQPIQKSQIVKSVKDENGTEIISSHKVSSSDIISTIKDRSIEDSLTLESEFISISEVFNEFDEDLEDIEVRDAIPFSYQIKEIKNLGDFELLSQNVDQNTGNVIFTWKKNNLNKGDRARIEYILQRRMHRSILIYSKEQILLINSYHTVKEKDNHSIVSIDFENSQEKILDFVLIEDTIPQELKVINFSPKDRRPLLYQSKDGLLYRWIMEEMKPNSKMQINYTLIEKPLTRWIIKKYTDDKDKELLVVEKIAEPILDLLESQYLIFFELKPHKDFETAGFILRDEISESAELIASYPVFFRPSIETKNKKRFLTWYNLKLEGKTRRVCVRLKTKGPFNPQEPVITFDDFSTHHSSIQEYRKISQILNLRHKMGISVIKSENK